MVETIRPPGFNEPPPYDGYYVECLAETERTRLYRRVDRRAYYLVDSRTGAVREISRAAATLNLLRIDRSITREEFRVLRLIFRIPPREVAA